MRRVLLPVLLAFAVALPAAGPSLSALRTGTNAAETLVGTDGNDQLNGMGGGDLLKGRAGNDTYFFGNNFSSPGIDRVIEKPGEGTDTLNFRGVTVMLDIYLPREWASLYGYYVTAGSSQRVELTYNDVDGRPVKSFIETVIGGRGDGDAFTTGGGPHTLQPGGGATDTLADVGGYNSPGGNPAIPPSNDVYKGFADNTGTDQVRDFGGAGDVLDMRPFALDDVYIAPVDFGTAGSLESLQIVTGPSSQVVVLGHFAPFQSGQQQGSMERIIFADQTITDLASVSSVSVASLSPKQARLAQAAPRLAREAQVLIERFDPIRGRASGRQGDATADARAIADDEQRGKHAKHGKNDKGSKAHKKERDRQGKPHRHRRR